MIVRSESPLVRTISTNSRSSASRGMSSRSPVMPMMAFIGVRISWDMFARNSLFERVAASAASFARTISMVAAF